MTLLIRIASKLITRPDGPAWQPGPQLDYVISIQEMVRFEVWENVICGFIHE